MRYKMIISYDGAYFYGYQRQTSKKTVQEQIEKCLTLIFKQSIEIKSAGRTDAKVHALGQVAHFDSEQVIPINQLKKAMNKILKPYIYIKEIEIVDDSFHARYDAIKKEYRYYISTTEYEPLKSQYIYFYPYKIDIETIKKVLPCFIGTKDFKSLSKGHDKENTIRTIYEFTVNENNGVYEFIIIGDGFLRNMVRIIIALILKFNENKLTIEDINQIIEAKDRKKAPWTAPAEGLYLYKIYYKEKSHNVALLTY